MTLSNKQVADYLNQHFVCAWETVHSVPKVTIDFGDGHKLERTIAGNTVMYVCLPDGRVVDAYPGVYTPEQFLAEVQQAVQVVEQARGATPAVAEQEVLQWHRSAFKGNLLALATRTTMSKAVVESPVLLTALGMTPRQALAAAVPVPAAADGPRGIAPAAPEAPVDGAAAVAAPAATPAASPAAAPPGGRPITISKRAAEAPVLRVLQPAAVPPSAVLNQSKAVAQSPVYRVLQPSVPADAAGTPPAAVNPVADPKGAFELLTSRIEDISHRPASSSQVRASIGLSAPPGTRPLSPEELGKLAVEADSANNVKLIRPAVHLLFNTYDHLPTTAEARDVIYKKILHVAIDDPYLGLADVLVPGTPAGQQP